MLMQGYGSLTVPKKVIWLANVDLFLDVLLLG